MPDFHDHEHLLELKLRWMHYKIEALQEKTSNAAIYLIGIETLLWKIERHIAEAEEMKECVGKELGQIHWELESLKKL